MNFGSSDPIIDSGGSDIAHFVRVLMTKGCNYTYDAFNDRQLVLSVNFCAVWNSYPSIPQIP